MKRILLLTVAASLTLSACSKSEDEGFIPPAVGKDFALKETTITYPDDSEEVFPDGPNMELVNNNCRACHSPSTILVQPPLDHAKWEETVKKMVEVYKAPIAPADVPGILAYLDDWSAKEKARLEASGNLPDVEAAKAALLPVAAVAPAAAPAAKP